MATALQDPMKSEAWPLCWKCKNKQKYRKLRWIKIKNAKN